MSPPSPKSNTFHIRTTVSSPADTTFILSAFDSSIPHLIASGSAQQWGVQPFSSRAGSRDRIDSWIAVSGDETAEQPAKLFIAEVELPSSSPSQLSDNGNGRGGLSVRTENGKEYLSVAAAGVRQRWQPTYFSLLEHLQPIVEVLRTDKAMYLELLISDFRTGPARKGAGGVLLAEVKEYARGKGTEVLYLDCFRGNGAVLVKFYEAQGFVKVAEFDADKPGEETWPGAVMKMDLTQ